MYLGCKAGQIVLPQGTLSTAEENRTHDRRSGEDSWAAIDSDLKQIEEDGIFTPAPNALPIEMSIYRMPKYFDLTPYAEEAASF